MSPPGEKPPSRAVAFLKKAGPYLVAIAALGWVFWHTNLHEMKEAFQRAPLLEFVAVSTVSLIINWMLDTFAMGAVFSWFGCKVPYKDLLIVRGSTYLYAIINYHVGQAAIVSYLYKSCKVPFLRASGWILFIIGINVGTLFLLASAGTATAPSNLAFLHYVPLASAAGVIFYAVLLLVKPKILAERRLFAPLFEMGIVGHIKGVAVRLPHIGNLIIWNWLCLKMFGFEVTLSHALLYMPAYFAVAALPINVNGLGVAQLVAVAFFAPFAPIPAGMVAGTAGALAAQKAAVIAWSLAVQGFSIAHQLVLGFICVGPATKLGVRAVEVEEPAVEAAS